MSLTIAQFTFGLQLAGQERVVVDLAKAFQKQGHRSLVCTTLFGGELVKELDQTGVPFQTLGLKKSYDPRALIRVMRYLKDNRVNVVMTHGTSGSLIPRVAAVLSKVPAFIHVEHNISEQKKFYHILINKTLSFFTDKIVCISESAQKSLFQIEKTSPHKVMVIPNGLNTERFSFIKNIRKSQNSTKRVGIVGRFNEQKGHIYFVEAAARIVKFYKNVEFIFVGDGPLRPMIEQRVKAYGLDKRCQFLGVRSDVGDLLQTFDVFVLSSLWEGMPISLLEAQYFGVASVVTNVGGIPEVIEDGYNGLIVQPKDTDGLASAILKVLRDDSMRNRLGQNGKEVFRHRFTIDKMADTYIDLIDKILIDKCYQARML